MKSILESVHATGVHEPCSRTIDTARGHACHFGHPYPRAPVHTASVSVACQHGCEHTCQQWPPCSRAGRGTAGHGPWRRTVFTGSVNLRPWTHPWTGHGCPNDIRVDGPCPRPVNAGSVYRPLDSCHLWSWSQNSLSRQPVYKIAKDKLKKNLR